MEPAAALAEAANQTFSPLFRDPSWNFPGLTDVPALPAPSCIATVGDYSYVADEDKLFEGARGPGLPEASGTQRDLVTEPAACELPMHQPTAVDITLALQQMPASILTCPPGFSMACDIKPSHKAGQGCHTTHEILAYAGLPPLRGPAAVPLHVADASVLYGGAAYPMAAYSAGLEPQSPTHLLHAASPGHFFDDLDDRDSALYPATPAAPPSAPPGFAPVHPHLAAHHLLPEAPTPPQGATTPSSRRTGPHRTRRSAFGTLRGSPSPRSPAAAIAAPQLAYAASFPDAAMPEAAAALRAGLGSGAYQRLEAGAGSYGAGSYAAGSYGGGSYGEAEGESSDSAFGARSGAGGAFPRPRGGIKKGGRRARRMVCRNCATHKTPQWRCGPEGPKTLCNACGLRLRKGQVLERYANLGPGQPLPPPPLGDCMSDSGSPCDSSI